MTLRFKRVGLPRRGHVARRCGLAGLVVVVVLGMAPAPVWADDPVDPKAQTVAVDPGDPRLGDVIEQAARDAFGDRYVDVWVADDQQGFVVGVFGATSEDGVTAAGWANVARVDVVDAPVSRGELDATLNAVVMAAGPDLVSAGPDYQTGKVVLNVSLGMQIQAIEKVKGKGRQVVPHGQKGAKSKPGDVVVETGEAPPASTVEVLSPAESDSSGPLRAGKRIWSNSGGCTSNALIQSGTSRYMVTAGHCRGVGPDVYYMSTKVGSIDKSTWPVSPAGETIFGDVARFSVPSTAKASVFQSDTLAANIVGWASPRENAQACFRGVSSGIEKCGTITDNGVKITYPTKNISVSGMSRLDVEATNGDSGAPVYYKGASGVVMLGVLSGGGTGYIYFTPFSSVLSSMGGALVMGTGAGMPGPIALSTPFSQIVLSPDFTLDSYGEVVAVDKSGLLVMYAGAAGGKVVGPAGVMGIGFTDHTVNAPGDWNGDGIADIITTTPDGLMWLFAGTGGGAMKSKVQIGNGWGPYTVVPAGDVTGDGHPDLLAVNNATGDLYLYAGNGTGGFKYPYPKVGNGWTGYKLYAGGDVNGDGKPDILSTDSAGNFFFYRGTGGGSFAAKVQVGNGWSGYQLAAGADMNGDGLADIVGRNNTTNDLYFYKSLGTGGFATGVKIGNGW